MHSEAYLDIVWRQFKKNRAAYWSLWSLAPLFLLAIFAPAIASNVPFVFTDGETTIYPWFNALFNPAEPVDFLFNMVLVGFFPWAAIAIATEVAGRRRGVPGRRRIGWVVLQFVAVTTFTLLLVKFGHVRPNNQYSDQSFPARNWQSFETAGWYPPIPLGSTEQDINATKKKAGYTSPVENWNESNDGFPHWLGTDLNGGDVLVRLIYGTRISLTVGFVAVGIYLVLGVVLGALAGFYGGWVDMLISRTIEVVLLFPSFFLILTVVALVGPSIYVIMIVIGLTGWPTIARLIRGEVLKQRSLDYTTAAYALGASNNRIIFRHILPNAISPALVAAPFGIASAIVTEAGLSLLGFGVRPPAPSWGTLLQNGSGNYSYWWLIGFPSLAIFLTVTIFNLVGSGLRDAMDPRLRM